MPNDDLWERLSGLESVMKPPGLSIERRLEISRSRRAEGWSEGDIFKELNRHGPPPRVNGYLPVAEYCFFERFDGCGSDWSASSPDPLPNLVGHLRRGGVCILGHPDDERRRYDLPPDVDWRSIDPTVVEALSRHVFRIQTWRDFWGRPKAHTENIVRYYLARAEATAAYRAEEDGVLDERLRREVRKRIDWILAHESEPEVLPWTDMPHVAVKSGDPENEW